MDKTLRFEDVFKRFKFPAGETHVEFRGFHPGQVLADVRNFNDLCDVVVAHRALRRKPTWLIPYFPFARHDRRRFKGDGEPLNLALEIAAEIDPIIVDPHSFVSAKLRHIPQSRVVEVFKRYGAFSGDHIVVIPDEGATKKAYEWIASGQTVVQGSKIRDPATGKLTGFKVGDKFNESRFRGRDVVIVDDICDGGGTFLGLLQLFKFYEPNSITLCVTHGLFTKGVADLYAEFTDIWTMDCYTDAVDLGVSTIPVDEVYEKGWI